MAGDAELIVTIKDAGQQQAGGAQVGPGAGGGGLFSLAQQAQTAQQAQQAGGGGGGGGAAGPVDIAAIAAQRLARLEQAKQIEASMRAQDAVYKAEQEFLDARRALTEEIRKETDEKRRNRQDEIQNRNENIAARQEIRDEREKERARVAAERQQEKDEDEADRIELRDQRDAERAAKQRIQDDPVLKARDDTQKAAQRKAFEADYKEERRRVDSDYAADEDRKQRQQQMSGATRIAAGIAAGQGGAGALVSGIGQMASASSNAATAAAGAEMMAAAPMAAAVSSIVEEVKQMVAKLFNTIGQEFTSQANVRNQRIEAIGAGNAMAFAKTYTDQIGPMWEQAADQMGIFSLVLKPMGPAIQANVNTLWALDTAAQSAANRLSQFSGVLQMQQAQQDMMLTVREMQRGNRFGELAAGASEARFSLEMRLGQITDRLLVPLLASATGMYRLLDQLAANIDEDFKALINWCDQVLNGLDQLLRHPVFNEIPGSENVHLSIAAIRALLQQMVNDTVIGDNTILNEFMAMHAQIPWIGAGGGFGLAPPPGPMAPRGTGPFNVQ